MTMNTANDFHNAFRSFRQPARKCQECGEEKYRPDYTEKYWRGARKDTPTCRSCLIKAKGVTSNGKAVGWKWGCRDNMIGDRAIDRETDLPKLEGSKNLAAFARLATAIIMDSRAIINGAVPLHDEAIARSVESERNWWNVGGHEVWLDCLAAHPDPDMRVSIGADEARRRILGGAPR